MDHGVDPNAIGWTQTPLMFAVCQFLTEPYPRWKEVVDMLLEAGADINARSTGGTPGWTALHHAIMKGHVDAVAHLVDRGIDLSIKNDDAGETGLDLVKFMRSHEKRRQWEVSDEKLDRIIEILEKHS